MEKKLYVGGLSYNTIENTLKEAFSQAGTVVSATIIMDKISGRSKGFGFVEMSSTDEAQKAIELFNGKELEGRSITVNEARPKESRPSGGGGFGYSGGSKFGQDRRGGRDRGRRDFRGGGRREKW